MVQLRYFASLREALGTGEEQLELPDTITTVAQLNAWLQTRGADWQEALGDPRLHTAVNQSVVKPDTHIHDGDEIAWFPPVTGG
ncbi:MAG: molybdopterin converting factor subunit 1 [Gammaproteobacteria bacterium]